MRFPAVVICWCAAICLLFGAWPAVGAAQSLEQGAQIQLSRQELQNLLAKYDSDAASPAYSDALRAQARRQATLIRARLDQGDFQVGDQVAISVEGEPQLSGTFAVQQGPALMLPVIGSISLRGVLRSELLPYLKNDISRYVRDPVVQVRSSIRIMITGAVGKVGWFVVPADMVVSDLLSGAGPAGGPAPNAQLKAVRVERNGDEILGGESFQNAIIQGQTLDQLGFQAGDQLVVPVKSNRNPFVEFQTVMLAIGSVTVLIGTLVQIF